MTEQFIGCTISIKVGGGLGYYQGIVKYVNPFDQMITLTKVIHNGEPINKSEVILHGEDIIELSILKAAGINSTNSQSHNEVSLETNEAKNSAGLSSNFSEHNLQNKHPPSSNPCKINDLTLTAHSQDLDTHDSSKSRESSKSGHSSAFLPIEANNGSKIKSVQTGNSYVAPTLTKKKSRTSVGEILAHGSRTNEIKNSIDKNNAGNSLPTYEHVNMRRNTNSLQNQSKRPWNKQWKNYRDESTFGTPIDDDVLNTEFDFEKNLALFDKQAVMEEIQNLKPDVVRQADRKMERNYRYDENILGTKPQNQRQIIVPAADAGEIIYATDNGLLVPSVSTALRLNLLSTANQNGLTKSRQLEMIGRAATEIIISVIGGSHRLEPGNSHQAPVVVLLCGANAQGAAGVNCGRQLESQGVQTVVITPPLPSSPTPSLLLSHETQLYAMTSGRIISDISTLPSTVDLIVDSRFDLHGNLGLSTPFWLSDTNDWASASRAPIVSLDPPSDISLPFTPRIRLCPSLPLAYSPDKGKVYLLNLNIPHQVFTSLSIKYTPPFGAKMVIPLHPCE